MRKILPIILAFICALFSNNTAYAQAGSVYTMAGGGSSTADGVPALSSFFSSPAAVATDGVGNIYVADAATREIKKIDGATGLIYKIAGFSATAGTSGDGGPATAASFSGNMGGLFVTASGDVYIADNKRIRKISPSTGIISTVAGGGTSDADGIPATNAKLNMNDVFVDATGNLYVGSTDRVRKVNAVSGIISTIIGGGSSSSLLFDTIMATAADFIDTPTCVRMDNAGNLYVLFELSADFSIWKLNAATGLVYKVAGGGSSTAEGVPAVGCLIDDSRSFSVDGAGNIFFGDRARRLIRRVDAATGMVQTIAGTTSGGSMSDGTPALSALVYPCRMWLNTAISTVYYSDCSTSVKKFTYYPMVPLSGAGSGVPPIHTSDSMSVSIFKRCSGPEMTVRTNSYHPGMTIRTYFGDGSADTAIVSSSWIGTNGYVLTDNVYPISGTYIVRHVLYNYGTPVDTLTYNYSHALCSKMSVLFYIDNSGNCAKDGTEEYLMKSIVTVIDSNAVPVDTVVATSGFSYSAYGNPGDVFRFRVLSFSSDLVPSCPLSGVLYDTLVLGITQNPVRWLAMSCVVPATSDLAVSAHVPVTGANDQWGHIYVRNNRCFPTDATVTLRHSHLYRYSHSTHSTPVAHTDTTITWNLLDVSNTDAAPRDLHFSIWHNPVFPYPVDGDIVNERITVTPMGGVTDVNMANNMIIRNDTVSTSCDPNEIVVSPSCFDNDTTFHFTVHFENIGSAPAENIYVMDTLSPWFDASTIDIEMSTHTMFTSKQVANGLTIYRFDFPNINLADSSDHANRDGAFMYTIKNKPGMPTGAIARSRVGIYFDYNDVLLTNTVDNRKGCPVTSVATFGIQQHVALFPNPTSGTLTIQTGNQQFATLAITNAIGQQLLQQSMVRNEQTIDVSSLPAGVYYLTLRGNEGTEVRKFVKW